MEALLSLCLVWLMVGSTTAAVECYQCSSFDVTGLYIPGRCGDPFNSDGAGVVIVKNQTYCSKTVAAYRDSGKPTDYYRVGQTNKDHKYRPPYIGCESEIDDFTEDITQCYCDEDLCNSGTVTRSGVMLALALMVGTLF